jgi:hemolysin D
MPPSEGAAVLSFSPARRRRDEREFLPAALEIVETPASPAGRILAGTIALLIVAAIAWASLGRIDIVATATGRILPTARVKVIQPFEIGVVRAIHVQEGQQVKAGDILVELDATANTAETARLTQALLAARLDAARLGAALSEGGDPEAAFQPPVGADEAQIQIQRQLLANQLEEQRAKLANLDRQRAQSEANRAAVAATIAELEAAIPLLRERVLIRKTLADRQLGSKLNALELQQDLVEHEHELQVQRGRLAEAAAATAAIDEQRREAAAEYRRGALAELAEAERKAAGLAEELVKAEQRRQLQTLAAPVDGTVQQLAVHTLGGVVTPAQPLMTLVPADSRLEIEAMVPNKDIGFVQAGQQAEIKVDTFNFTRYGLLHGTVLSVSPDAITRDRPGDRSGDRQTGATNETSEPKGQELVYAARISLDSTAMQVEDRLVNLTPGMAVTVEIKTGSRRVIEYLLSPLLRYAGEVMRER